MVRWLVSITAVMLVSCDKPEAGFDADIQVGRANIVSSDSGSGFASGLKSAFPPGTTLTLADGSEAGDLDAAKSVASDLDVDVLAVASMQARDQAGNLLTTSALPFKLCLKPGKNQTASDVDLFVSSDGRDFAPDAETTLTEASSDGANFVCFFTSRVNKIFALFEKVRPADLSLALETTVPAQMNANPGGTLPFILTVGNRGAGHALGCAIDELASHALISMKETTCSTKIKSGKGCQVELLLSLETATDVDIDLGFSCKKGSVSPLRLTTKIIQIGDSGGNSGGSTTDTTPPEAAVVQNPTAFSTSATVTATWTASTSDDVASYNVKACTDSACSTGCSEVVAAASNATSQGLSGLTHASSYHLCVEVVDQAGNSSGFSSSTSKVTIDTENPSAPTNPQVPATFVASTSPAISWTASSSSDMASYEIKACTDAACSAGCSSVVTATASETSKSVSGLTEGLSYRACVRAVDQSGRTSSFVASTGQMTIDTTNPSSVTVSDPTSFIFGSNTMNASWSGGSDTNFDTFQAKLCTDAGCSASCTAPTSSTSSPVGVTLPSADVAYHVCVSSQDQAGNTTGFSASTGTVTQKNVSVDPIYPNNGANWNDYVENNGADWWSATDTACTGSGNGYYSCVHGGEYKKLVLDWESSCSGLSASDALDVFKWRCDVLSGNVTFRTNGFKVGKGVAQMLNASSWKTNSVTVTGLSYPLTTPSAAWWTNPVAPAPSNGGGSIQTLSASGTLYTVASSMTTAGYQFTGSKMGLIVLPGQILSHDGGTTNNCNKDTGLLTSPDKVVIYCTPAGADYFWHEGWHDGIDRAANFARNHSDYTRARNVVLLNSGLYYINGDHSFVDFNRSYNSDTVNINGNYNSVHDYLASNPANAINTTGSYSTFHKIRIFGSNATNGAVRSYNKQNIVIVDVAVASNQNYGMRVYNGTTNHHRVVGVTTVNNTSEGFNRAQNDTANGDYLSILALNNDTGARIGGSNSTFAQIVTSANTTDQLSMYGVATYDAQGIYMIGNGAASNCSTGGGIFHHDTNCGPINGSAHTLAVNNLVPTGIVVGKIGSNDSVNTSDDSSGKATFPGSPNTFDWFNFEQDYRGWGLDGSAFPNVDHRGRWIAGTGTIWDLRLRSDNTTVRNRSGNGTSNNNPFVAGSTCPAELHGNQVINSASGRTYLRLARELMFDNVGDDDGLCESNEACLYTPNIGAYQGEGDHTQYTCNFQDGTVSGVTVYAHPQNGAADSDNPQAVAYVNTNSYESSTTFDIPWTPSTSGDVTQYNVKVCSANDCSTGCASTSKIGPLTYSTSTTVSGPGTYYACVQAQDVLGNVSAFVASSPVVVDLTNPTPPTTKDSSIATIDSNVSVSLPGL